MVLATNYAAIIRPLQLLVICVAGLFLLRVLRVSALQARPVDAEGTRRKSRGGALAIELIEPTERAGERIEVERSVTIGRSPDCELSIWDNYISSRHAVLANDQGDLTIEDLGSTNGTYVNQELIQGRIHLERGDIVQTGGVIFEVVR